MAALPDFRPPAPVEHLVGANQALILNSDSDNEDNRFLPTRNGTLKLCLNALVYLSRIYAFKASEEWRSYEAPGCATSRLSTIHLMSQSSRSPADVPKDVPLGQEPLLKPEHDRNYACDICGQRICVGDGGNKNFLQHRGSPGCLKAAKKAATASNARHAAQNAVKITSFFSKATGRVPKPTSSTTGLMARTPFSPPLLPRSSLDQLDQPGNQTAWSAGDQPSAHPDPHAIALLDSLDLATQDLPLHILEAGDEDRITQVVLGGGPDDAADAWEFLDRRLNGLLGYSVSVDEVAGLVRRGPYGVKGLAGYIWGFVIDYGIPGALLEGKVDILLKAISLIKRCVAI